jgi:hypothetical protein
MHLGRLDCRFLNKLISRDMTQPVFPINTVHLLPPQQMSLRSRREVSTRDAANARNYELWQTDGKYGIQNRADVNARAPFQDFLPINSRFLEKNYRTQPRFDQNADQGGMNPYFAKYDSASDSRNAVRETQAVVYEDKDTEGLRASRSFLGRAIDNHYFNEDQLKAIVESVDNLKPLRDDYQKNYREEDYRAINGRM